MREIAVAFILCAFLPPRVTESSTRIRKHVEDLRRGLNADIGRKDFFEMTSKHRRL